MPYKLAHRHDRIVASLVAELKEANDSVEFYRNESDAHCGEREKLRAERDSYQRQIEGMRAERDKYKQQKYDLEQLLFEATNACGQYKPDAQKYRSLVKGLAKNQEIVAAIDAALQSDSVDKA